MLPCWCISSFFKHEKRFENVFFHLANMKKLQKCVFFLVSMKNVSKTWVSCCIPEKSFKTVFFFCNFVNIKVASKCVFILKNFSRFFIFKNLIKLLNLVFCKHENASKKHFYLVNMKTLQKNVFSSCKHENASKTCVFIFQTWKRFKNMFFHLVDIKDASKAYFFIL